MATKTPDGRSVHDLEAAVTEGLEAQAGHVEETLDAVVPVEPEELAELESPTRPAIAIALASIGASVMVGGIFIGVSPRIYAGIASLLGIGLAIGVQRIKRPIPANLVAAGGIFCIGLLLVAGTGIGGLADLRTEIAKAIVSGKVLRPPADFTPGWAAILGWIMSMVTFAATWVALVLKRVPLGVIAPLPLAVIAGISVPSDAQLISGLVVLVLFVAALGVMAGGQITSAGEKVPIGYELRRSLKALPLVAVVTVVIFFLGQTGLLFPHPVIDPSLEPQKPKPQPLGAVVDKDLFDVKSATITGPWVLGHLDVYDGHDWLLPPFAENKTKTVPASGVVDPSLKPGEKATFIIRGLDGAVLPGLPNDVGVIAQGPTLAYDSRNSNIRLVEGQVEPGFEYTVVAAALPTVQDLSSLGNSLNIPDSDKQFTSIPPAPAAVKALIKQAPTTSKWDEYNFLRTWILQNVTVSGTGLPVSVTPERVAQMIAGNKEGSPFEIVAAQAMLARWIGVPSRIGYGYDNGTKQGGVLQVHPSNGIAFPEVFFPGYEWLPVIGTPTHVKVSEISKTQFSVNATALPSQDISVPIFIPLTVPPQFLLYQTLQPFLLAAAIVLLVLAALYFSIPVVLKALRRHRIWTAADRAGPRAQIAAAYAEWRDYCTDYGYRHRTDTPLMFLSRFVPDTEHGQLAWLVTRTLWGDLKDEPTADMAADAKELSRSLRRRLSLAQPFTVRMVGFFSRLSLREAYDPGVGPEPIPVVTIRPGRRSRPRPLGVRA